MNGRRSEYAGLALGDIQIQILDLTETSSGFCRPFHRRENRQA